MGDLSAPLPRVNGELLPRFVGRKVLLVGRVVSLDSGSMRVETCDKRQVTVALKAGAGAYANSDFIEFEATVESPEAVRELDHAKFGTSFGACPPGGVAAQTSAPPPKQGLGALAPCAHAERRAACLPHQTWTTTTSWSRWCTAKSRRCSSEPPGGQAHKARSKGAGQRTRFRSPLRVGVLSITSTHGPRLLTRPQPVGLTASTRPCAQLKPQGKHSLLFRARAAKPAA